MTPRFLPAGDTALVVEFGSEIAHNTNRQATALWTSLTTHPLRGVQECVPTYSTLLVHYDPQLVGFAALVRKLQRRLRQAQTHRAPPPARVFSIPVCYNGADLPHVAAHAHCTIQEVIAMHTAPKYHIYMLGFLPGFAYLGGLDPRIHTPRLAVPRTQIPAGSVGIGGAQTGIYPLASPGGWQLIGRTPVAPYSPTREPSILYRAGDAIRFFAITESAYNELLQKQNNNEPIWTISYE